MGLDKYIKNYIGGTLTPAASGHYLEDVNPATGEVFAKFPDSGAADVQRAIEAARKAFPTWSSMEPLRRFRLLMRIADIIEQNTNTFARAETLDTGKPLAMSKSVDIPRAQLNFRYYAAAILQLEDPSFHQPGEAIHYTMRKPLGIIGCVAPWNLPLYLLTWKIAPALAAGNCVVAKPSELTPMTAHLLANACIEAGLPAGVLNIIHGKDEKVIPPILESPDVPAITFTGDAETGKKIALAAAALFKKVALDLGGKNPNIIFADCDFDQMMVGTLRSSFSNNGQICYAGSRIFVERPLYQKTRDELVKRTQFLKVGDPFSSVTDLGAIISGAHRERVLSYLALAEMEGGKVLCGGNPMEMTGDFENGFFMRPAVIEGLPPHCRTNQEEIFGPVVTITPFDTEEEVIALANSTPYGLSASIWTKNVERANLVAEKLSAGIVWINCWMLQDLRPPVERHGFSGLHRDGGIESLRFFTQAKMVSIKY